MRSIAALAICLLFPLVAAPFASAQAHLAWQQIASSGAYDDASRAVAFGAGGEAVIAGRLRDTSGSTYRAWLWSRDASGASLGSHAWPPAPGGTYSWTDVDVGPGGDVAVAGAQPGGAMVARCAPSCAFVWGPTTLPAPFAVAGAVLFDASGDVLVAGSTTGADVFVARYSPTGTLVDSTTWAHPAGGSDHASALAVDAAGDVLVAGVADFGAAERVYLLRLTASLDFVVFAERLGIQSLQPGPALALDAAGNTYVASRTAQQGGPIAWVFSLWKVHPDGSTAWLAQSGDAAHPFGLASSVAIDPSGNIAVAGSWYGGNETVGRVESYDPSGALRWSRAAPVPESPFDAVAVDAGGDVVVAGWAGSPRRASSARYDRDGGLRWLHVDSDWSAQGTPAIGVGVAPGGGAVVAFGAAGKFGAPQVLRWYRIEAAFFPVCEGDGSLAACPCGNASDPAERAGCVHSQGSGGRLDGVGYASLAADTLVLAGTTMPNTSVLYFQGDAAIAPAAFGDGLRCSGGSLVRLGVRTNVGGSSSFPAPGDAALSVAGSVGVPSTRWYQAWYRDPAPHCTADVFNASNALRVAWAP